MIPTHDLTMYRANQVTLSAISQRYTYVNAYNRSTPLSWSHGPVIFGGSISYILERAERFEVAQKIKQASGARASLLITISNSWEAGNPAFAFGLTPGSTLKWTWPSAFSWSSGYTWGPVTLGPDVDALRTVGVSQSGATSIVVRGAASGAVIAEGQWIGLGDGHAYQVTARVVFGLTGSAQLLIDPPLRAEIPNNTLVSRAATLFVYAVTSPEPLVSLEPGPMSRYTLEFVQDQRQFQ